MKRMFTQKQIEEIIQTEATRIAQEVVASTPRGFDLNNITIGQDLVDTADLVAGKLPYETISEATETQIALCKASLKEAIKKGYIDDSNHRLLLNVFSDEELGSIEAIFGQELYTEVGYSYAISITDSSIAIVYNVI